MDGDGDAVVFGGLGGWEGVTGWAMQFNQSMPQTPSPEHTNPTEFPISSFSIRILAQISPHHIF